MLLLLAAPGLKQYATALLKHSTTTAVLYTVLVTDDKETTILPCVVEDVTDEDVTTADPDRTIARQRAPQTKKSKFLAMAGSRHADRSVQATLPSKPGFFGDARQE